MSENRERVAEGIRIPFVIVDTVAQIPSNVRLDTVVRMSVEELKIERLPVDRRPERSFLEIFKAVDEANEAIKTNRPRVMDLSDGLKAKG